MNSALRFLEQIRSLGVVLTADEGRLRFRAPQGVMTDSLLAQLREHKWELLSLIAGPAAPIARLADGRDYELSHAQRRLWVLAQLESDAAAYNVPLHQLLEGALDCQALEEALARVVRRHESLQTAIVSDGGLPKQRILPAAATHLALVDLTSRPDAEQAARQMARDQAQRPFDLERGPPLRAALLKLAEERHVLLLTIHHLVCDGVSIAILGQELARQYAAALRGEPDPLPPLDIQYRDFAAWQNLLLDRDALSADRQWWHNLLAAPLPTLELPTDFPRPAMQTFRGREQSFLLPGDRLEALREHGRRSGASLFMTLLATLKVLLYKHTGQTDLIVGCPVAGRDHPQLHDQVGLYLNVLPLRSRLDPDETWDALLDRVRSTALAAFDRQSYPFDRLVDELRVPRDLSRNPLFDVTLILQNQEGAGLSFEGLEVRPFVEHPGTSKTDLTFNASESQDGLVLSIEYNTDLFVAERIAQLGEHFLQLVDGILSEPSRAIGDLDALSPAERRQRAEFNATTQPYPENQTVVDLFEQQVRHRPDAVAVRYGQEQLTYRELNGRADRLASRLAALGVGPNVLVGICLERSVDLMVGVLGVLKAGGAYVPLDPAFPGERLSYMAADAQIAVLLTQVTLQGVAPAVDAPVLLIDQAGDREQDVLPFPRFDAADRLAYVIYTSGSTGRPKGVAVPHRALTNFLLSMARKPGLNERDVLLAVTTLSFDIAGLELLLPLVCGAQVLIADRDTASDGLRLRMCLEATEATVMQATPATWQMLLAAQWQGSPTLKILCGGEAMSGGLAEQLLARGGYVWNLYGPTETTIWSTLKKVEPRAQRPALEPIGRPIANTQVYVLDARLRPVPAGVPGDLYIGGVGLAVGYWKRDELTAERFITCRLPGGESARLCRTGDSARWGFDGELHFLGRTDNQVKLRGHRIELGEIEAALAEQPGVDRVVAGVRNDPAGDKRLVAWFEGSAEVDALRRSLRDKLPDYMVPAYWVRLGAFPLTPNGKVDRRALPDPGQPTERAAAFQPPRTDLERSLATIWQDVLGVQQVGLLDNFFVLGGHSLKATQVVGRIDRDLGATVTIRDLFNAPSLADFANRIANARRQKHVAISPIADAPHYELSPAQRRMWVLSQTPEALAAYNMPVALLLKGALDAEALRVALAELVQRHESLRTVFETVDGKPQQAVQRESGFDLVQLDLSDWDEPYASARQLAIEDAERVFDLERGPTVRATLLNLGHAEHALLLNVHHIAADAWSLDVLVRELGLLYRSHGDKAGAKLAPLPIQYRDYAHWQNRYLESETAAADRDYWLATLAPAEGGSIDAIRLDLPTDRPRPRVKTYCGRTHAFGIDGERTARLVELARRQQCSPFMVLTTIVKVLLHRYTGQDDVLIGAPLAGRNHPDLENQVGLYVNTLPLRTRLAPELPFADLLDRVKATVGEAYEHQAYPFDRLVDELGLPRDVSRNPLFEVVVLLQHEEPPEMAFPGIEIRGLLDEHPGSKFDLHFVFEIRRGKLEAAFIYNTDLFLPDRIERMAGHFVELIDSALTDPQQPIGKLNLLTQREREAFLSATPKGETPPTKTLTQWFEEQAARTPEMIAVSGPGLAGQRSELTYSALNARANQLAHRLRRLGVGPDALVGLTVERSLDVAIGILGILKAGGAYLPLDPAHPRHRRALVLADAKASVLVAHRALAEELSPEACRVVCLDADADQLASESTANPPPVCSPANLAYVIYTSGSTGQPKGVPVTHANVARLFMATEPWFGFGAEDVWTLFHSYAFDFSVWELWGALLYGGRVAIVPHAVSRSPDEFCRLLVDEKVTVLNQTPSAFRALLPVATEGPKLDALRLVIFGGEALDPRMLRPWFAQYGDRRPELVNMYGITETTVHVTYRPFRSSDADSGQSLIGWPIPDLRLYLLDRSQLRVPVGITGEIYVGGAGVAQGYLNRPDLTGERFLPDPFAPGERMYRSGDLARWTADGDLEYLGRGDQQVQIRGFRVELGEIEAVLAQHPSVNEAVVVARTDEPGRVRLVAYLSPGSADIDDLRRMVRQHLPDYMLPAAFIALDGLPRTASDKIDWRALPSPDSATQTQAESFVPPRDDVERVLADIFAEVLRVAGVGAFDNFFDRGGDSLSATQIVARVRQVFRVDFSLVQFFPAASVAELAVSLRKQYPRQVEKVARALARLRAMSPAEKQSLLDPETATA